MRFTALDALPVDPSSPVPAQVTDANADSVGRALWIENWRLTWDLHPDYEDAVDWDDEKWESFDPQTATPPADINGYAFMELFGDPPDGVAARVIDYYRYQCDTDAFRQGITYGSEFTDALKAMLRARNGPDVDLKSLPGWASAPWTLKETDRDLFLRTA